MPETQPYSPARTRHEMGLSKNVVFQKNPLVPMVFSRLECHFRAQGADLEPQKLTMPGAEILPE
jgi:hypothetical protein